MPVARDVVASLARVAKLLHRKDDRKDGSRQPQIDDMCRLWSEGRDASEIARMTGHNRKAAVEYRFIDDHGYPVGPGAPHHSLDGARAEVVGAVLHGEAAGTHDGGAQYPRFSTAHHPCSIPAVIHIGTDGGHRWHRALQALASVAVHPIGGAATTEGWQVDRIVMTPCF